MEIKFYNLILRVRTKKESYIWVKIRELSQVPSIDIFTFILFYINFII